jgi:hypothetical protein
VTFLLDLAGVSWPSVDEDHVRAFAGHVRAFAERTETTHQGASSTVREMGAAYSGMSYDTLVATWTRKSHSHLRELLEACRTVATALDAAADVIAAAKLAALAELAALATTFVADQAAAVLTFGLAEAAEAAVIEAVRKLVRALERQLEQHILGEVIARAVEPLEHAAQQALGGLAFQETRSDLGASPATGIGFAVSPDWLKGYARDLHGHGEAVAGHARAFDAATANVRFGG